MHLRCHVGRTYPAAVSDIRQTKLEAEPERRP